MRKEHRLLCRLLPTYVFATAPPFLRGRRVARPESSKGVQNVAPTPFEDSGRATQRAAASLRFGHLGSALRFRQYLPPLVRLDLVTRGCVELHQPLQGFEIITFEPRADLGLALLHPLAASQ